VADFFKKLVQRFQKADIDWEDLEHQLIAGDLGAKISTEIVDDLKAQARSLHDVDIVEVTKKHLRAILPAGTPPPLPFPDKPRVILVVGVNGTGKTTSSAKLAHLLKKRGQSVVLAAADTFRAAAVEQLEVWAKRIDVPLVKGPPNADPAAVCFDAYTSAQARGAQFLICDTAGRLHTRHNLMEELRKVLRVIAKKDSTAPHEIFLVVDATTGGNALQQAAEFNKAAPLTGLIVTKLDGSGKGGIIVRMQHELRIPTRFIGTGEGVDDFTAFNSGAFLDQVL
jgi:fused signal recognition particle receptor